MRPILALAPFASTYVARAQDGILHVGKHHLYLRMIVRAIP